MKLSNAQNEAVKAINGQYIAVACPGSGKTTCIVQRAAYMKSVGIDPMSMLQITFTKAAAEEMEKRFEEICGTKSNFSTIHAFCYRLLAANYGYQSNKIMSQGDAWVFIAGFLRKNGILQVQIEEQVKEIMSGISFVKNRNIPPALYKNDKVKQELFVKAYKAYEDYRISMHKIDFDDMLLDFRRLLQTDKRLLKHCRDIYKYITVDEFQDVNQIQADIIYLLTGDNGNLFVVGDDDQSIYGFRAAEPRIMLEFMKKYPNAKKIDLTTNYRSGKAIVKAAASLISQNSKRFNKSFIASREEQGVIFVNESKSSVEQTEEIVKEIINIQKNGKSFSDIAILYRTNELAIPFAVELSKKDIPFHMTEHIASVHEDPIFYDVKAYWRLSSGQEADGDLQRILNRPGRYLKSEAFKTAKFSDPEDLKRRAAKLNGFAREKVADMIWDIRSLAEKKPHAFMHSLKLGIGYREWLYEYADFLGKERDIFLQTFDAICEEAKGFDSMKEWFKFADQYDYKLKEAAKKKNRTGICLSTFHSAKGLEWDTVFVTNVNRGVTPYKKATTQEEYEEERRAFYVAITRAMNNLYISYIKSSDKVPSPYIMEMQGKTRRK